MDIEELKAVAVKATAAEKEAKERHKEAIEARRLRMQECNAAIATAAGLVARETIVTVPHRYSWERTKGEVETLAYMGPSDAGIGWAIGRVVTKNNKLYVNRHPIQFNIEMATDTGRKLTT